MTKIFISNNAKKEARKAASKARREEAKARQEILYNNINNLYFGEARRCDDTPDMQTYSVSMYQDGRIVIEAKPIIPTYQVIMVPDDRDGFSAKLSFPLDITQFIVKEKDKS